MQDLKSHTISCISAVRGLCISDIIAARNEKYLQEQSITHVLSLTSARDAPKYSTKGGMTHRIVEIEDDPLADLVSRLGELCAWIDNALSGPAPIPTSPSADPSISTSTKSPDVSLKDPEQEELSIKQPTLLIHCHQGISRSGALVVAYLMHSLSLSYPSALALARKDREIVTPNSGFVKQLELWGELGCSLIDAEGKEKGRFAAWKKVREDVMRGGEEERNRARVRAMASMAARFGARRLKSEEEREESGL